MTDKELYDIDKELEIDISSLNDFNISIPGLTSPNWNSITGSYNAYSYSANATGAATQYNHSVLNSNWINNSIIGNGTSINSKLRVTEDAEFEGDIKWKGRSLGTMLEAIESRLAILTPDPAKLEKYEALRKAYDNYRLMEKLIGED